MTVQILESDAEIKFLVANAISQRLNMIFKKAAANMSRGIQPIIENAILSSPTVLALTNAQLRNELGIVNASQKVDDIIRIWSSNIVVRSSGVEVVGNGRIEGGFTVNAILSNWNDVLTEPSARQITEKGFTLEWLRWLLLEGSSVVVATHRFFPIASARSRTGFGLMAEGGTFRVPSNHAGTTNDNFVTRAIDDNAQRIDRFLRRELANALR